MTLFKALNVSKSFKKGFLKSAYLKVIDSISINIESGEAVAIVGPNGSGKSTFINLITGLYRPSSGQVLYRDKVIDGTSHMKDITACMANGTGLVMDMKVRQFLTYKSRLYEREFDEKSEYIDMMQLRQLLDKRISFCSAGETQRINILGSLIAYPEVFIFDEPTNCLDIQTKFIFLDILEAIKREGKTIILVTHHTDEIMRMKRMVMFGNGRIVSDHAVEGSRESIDERLLDLCNNHYSKGVI